MVTPSSASGSSIRAVLAEQEKAVNIASTATGIIVSLCFFVLPLVWSNVFRLLPTAVSQPPASSVYDPWSDFKHL